MNDVVSGMFSGTAIFMVILFIVFIVMFVGAILIIFNPKVRAKFMGGQLKAQKQVIDENEDVLRHISNKTADIKKDAIKTTASAIKEGFSGSSDTTSTVYCKHCGVSIDENSTFCKKCGNKQ